MPRAAIVDTGPLVAFLDQAERHHGWTVAQVRTLDAPLLVCEPVLAEAMFLLSGQPKAQDALFDLIAKGAMRITFQVGEHLAPLCALHRKYSDRPISLADACIVRMAKLFEHHLRDSARRRGSDGPYRNFTRSSNHLTCSQRSTATPSI